MALLRVAATALLLSMSFAPYQCAKEPDPNRRIEDDPADTVYKLAERFKTEGKAEARATTLKYLVEQFPTSRRAKQARLDLEEMGQPLPPPKD